MSRRRFAVAFLLPAIVSLAATTGARGQGLSVDVSAGSVVYDALAANISTTNVMGTVRFDAPRGGWVYGTAAVPLRHGDPLWGAFGAGGRVLPPRSTARRLTVGLDVGGEGFVFRDAVADQTGREIGRAHV